MARKRAKFWSDKEPQEEEEVVVSRSAIKRQHKARLDLAERLVESSPHALVDVPLIKEVLQAVAHARSIRQHQSRRRQVQFIAGLITNEDAILEALGTSGPSARDLNMQDLERWRKRILDGGDDVIDAFMLEHPRGDRQQLRQARRLAAREVASGSMGKACKRLFGLLRASHDE
ncbi:MAG: ribosome-associated protein [Kiritimatiellia bacterium]|jgi:ribosome-associated protein